MNNQNGYTKDEDLPTLTRTELIEKVRTARQMWRERDVEFEAMKEDLASQESLAREAELGADAANDERETLDAYAKDNANLRETIEVQNQTVRDQESLIGTLRDALNAAADEIMDIGCKAKKAYRIVETYHKLDDEEKGGQHASPPSK